MCAGEHFLPERAAEQPDFVDVEFAGGELLNVQITLELAMKLLAGAVVVVESGDLGRRAGQVCPIGVHFNLRDQAATVQLQGLQLPHTGADKLRCAFLAVLLAWAQIMVEHIALGSDVGEDWSVAVMLFCK
jgi:hypothetical protein